MSMELQGRLCETGQPATVTIEGTRITAVETGERTSPMSAAAPIQNPKSKIQNGDLWIAPGFIDLQLNGYGGYDFNQRFWGQRAGEERSDGGRAPGSARGQPAADTIARIVELAARAGTAMLCPTICTNSHDAMIGGLREIAR